MAGYVRKYAKKAKKIVKRRYFKGGKYSKPNVYTMAKDISLLRGMLNSEKKVLSVSTGPQSYYLGQVNNNNSGHFIQGFSPNLMQGVESNQRIGSQIKLTSFHMDIQLWAQPNAISGNRFLLEIWHVIGQREDLANFMTQVYTPNSFTSGGGPIYDLTSNRNVDNFKNYICIHRQKMYLPAEDLSGQTAMRNFNVGKRFGKNGHIVRYASPDFPDVTSGQLVLVMRADQGNAGNLVSGITGIVNGNPETACWYKANVTYYYIDN